MMPSSCVIREYHVRSDGIPKLASHALNATVGGSKLPLDLRSVPQPLEPGRRSQPGCNQHWRKPMNWDRVQGNWKQFTGKVKEQWGQLTDDDLSQIDGNREQLEGRLQARYGYA